MSTVWGERSFRVEKVSGIEILKVRTTWFGISAFGQAVKSEGIMGLEVWGG